MAKVRYPKAPGTFWKNVKGFFLTVLWLAALAGLAFGLIYVAKNGKFPSLQPNKARFIEDVDIGD